MADNKFTAPETLARCEAMGRLQSVLGGKWKILILWYVAFYRVQRFGELRRRLEDAFLPDNRILGIKDYAYTFRDVSLTVTFTALTVFGDVPGSMEAALA